MKKVTCPVCGEEVYQFGKLMAEVKELRAVHENGERQFIDNTGKYFFGRLAKTTREMQNGVVAHEIHPCSFWEIYKGRVPAVAKKQPGWVPDKDNPNHFVYEPIVRCDDKLSEKTVIEILKSDDPMQALEDVMNDRFGEEAAHEIGNMVGTIIREYIQLDKCNRQVQNWVHANCTMLYPSAHFLNQDVYMTIELCVGDENASATAQDSTDFCINNMPTLLWLAKQHGYTKAQVRKALENKEYGGSPFLASMRAEMLNANAPKNVVTVLWKTTLRDAIRLRELVAFKDAVDKLHKPAKSTYIVLDKNAHCGLYDGSNGVSSLFCIALEKDVRIPAKYIIRALADGSQGPSIRVNFGNNSRIWGGGGVKEIHFPKKTLDAMAG